MERSRITFCFHKWIGHRFSASASAVERVWSEPFTFHLPGTSAPGSLKGGQCPHCKTVHAPLQCQSEGRITYLPWPQSPSRVAWELFLIRRCDGLLACAPPRSLSRPTPYPFRGLPRSISGLGLIITALPPLSRVVTGLSPVQNSKTPTNIGLSPWSLVKRGDTSPLGAQASSLPLCALRALTVLHRISQPHPTASD
jgi:hypothetical protein